MNKHKKIAIVLHSLNGAGYIAIGYAIFVISGAFTSCTTESFNNDASQCINALLLIFGIPILLALTPIIALIKYGTISKMFLKGYSILIAVLLIPIGTIVGMHTLKLLKISSNET